MQASTSQTRPDFFGTNMKPVTAIISQATLSSSSIELSVYDYDPQTVSINAAQT